MYFVSGTEPRFTFWRRLKYAMRRIFLPLMFEWHFYFFALKSIKLLFSTTTLLSEKALSATVLWHNDIIFREKMCFAPIRFFREKLFWLYKMQYSVICTWGRYLICLKRFGGEVFLSLKDVHAMLITYQKRERMS